MKKLILIFSLLISFNISAKSSFDLEINNLSIGDSLLKEFSRTQIKNEIKRNLDFYSTYELDHTFVEVFFYSKTNKYEYVSFYVKPNDPHYKIHGLSGIKMYQDKIEACLGYLDKQVNLFSTYKNLTQYETFEGEHPIDPSGKSYVKQTFFETKEGEIIELQCADYDPSVQKNGDNGDYYGIYIITPEVEDWFGGA